MSQNEQPSNLPLAINLLDENKKIIVLNSEHETIFGQIKKELEEDKYNSIVTMENYPSMKASATELNKTAKFINDFKIAKVKLETKDIETFKSNCKLYIESIQTKRETILEGLELFEEDTRKQVLKVCTVFLNECLDELNIRQEFRTVSISDMTLTGYMTKGGAISKKGREEVERRVNEKLALQNKVDLRLSNLENECLKANIAVMTKEHIQGFLLEDDETYKAKLDALIQIEIKRAKAEKARIESEARIKAEKEAKEKILAEQRALKTELEARYQSRIRNATLDQLLVINIELQSHEGAATYELKQLSANREKELSEEKETTLRESDNEAPVNEAPQEQHLRDIAREPVKQVVQEQPKATDGKVLKTLSIKINVSEHATDEQVIGAVINMIKADKFPTKNIEVN